MTFRPNSPLLILLLAIVCGSCAAHAEVAAAYDAGVAGNPAVAPNPSSVAGGGWTQVSPASDVGNFQSAALSPDGATGMNAWRILDASTAASQFLYWTKPLNATQLSNMTTYGWRYSALMRVADPVAGNGGAQSVYLLVCNNANKRWIIFFDVNASNQLTAWFGGPNTTITLTGVDPAVYHLHEMVYSPATGTMEYFVDGVSKFTGYAGTTGTANGPRWGTESSGGRGDGYFNSVTLTINDPPRPILATSPASQSVAVGSSVTLTGSFSGAVTTYQWFKDTLPIAGANSASLTINPVGAGDAGDYWLRATNANGRSETATAAMEILQPGAPLTISEFLAENDGGLVDQDGEQPDWIELHNPSTTTQSTAGWLLSDDPAVPAKWMLPAVDVAPGGFLIVFASGKNRAVAGSELHTNFSLQNSGGYLALAQPSGNVVSSFTYPGQYSDTSYGSTAHQPAKVRFFLHPTPGAPNVDGLSEPRKEPVFAPAAGTFVGTTNVAASTTAAGGTLRYTTDGTLPDFDSAAYTAPLSIGATTQVRAAMLFSSERYGSSATAAYVRLAPDVQAFTSPLPVLLLHNLGAGPVPGVSARGPNGDGSDVVSVAMQANAMTILDEALGDTAMTSPVVASSRAGLRLRGSSSFSFAKKSYVLETWAETNDDSRDVSLLGMPADNDWVLYGPDPAQFDQALIHNSLIYELSRQSGYYSPRVRFVEVFLNTTGGDLSLADHRGLYLLVEKPKRGKDRVDFKRMSADGTSGGWMINVDRMDSLPVGSTLGSVAPRHFHTGGPDGTLQAPDDNPRGFQAIVNGVASGSGILPANDDMPNFYHSFFNFESPRGWDITPVQRTPIQNHLRGFDTALYGPNYTDPVLGYAPYIDVASWAHLLAMQCFAKNSDGIVLSGYLYRETPASKLRGGPLWDFDRAYNRNQTNGSATDRPTWIHDRMYFARLTTDPEFMQAYIDKWQDLRRGAFADANVQAVVDAQAAEITTTVAARSGISAGAWTTNIATLKTWLTARGNAMDALYTQPVAFSQNGGSVVQNYQLTMSAPPGSIYYTTNGTDPRVAGGGIAGGAQLYSGAVTIAQPTMVFARAKNGSAWSGTTVFTFYPPQDLSTLRVTEINYHPPAQATPFVDGDEFEFLELKNSGAQTLDLMGLSFSGITYSFPSGSTLAPGAYLVLVRNPAAFSSRYPGVSYDGVYTGRLDNAGESLALMEGASVVWSFDYNDRGRWPSEPDGSGFSLQRPDESWPGYDFATWTAAAPSPGAELSLVDTDSDGMPDYFEALYSVADSAADDDGDGANNLDEFMAGTDPRDPASYFHVIAKVAVTPGDVVLEFETLAGRTYAVEFRDGYGAGTQWNPLQTIPADVATVVRNITTPRAVPQRLYRVVTQSPVP